jgi:rhodanese-related sulfurtransferase
LLIRQFVFIPQVIIVLLFGLSPITQAADQPDKSSLEIKGAIKVSAEDVFSLYEKIPGLVILDTRLADGPSSGRANGYIEGSYSLPDIDTTCATLAKAIPRKDTNVVFYCNGPKCGRSEKSIKVALSCGYSKLYWFRGGFEEWQEKKYPYLSK